MSTPEGEDANPYAPPLNVDSRSFDAAPASGLAARELVKQFRTQIHAIGAAWIFFAALAGLLLIYVAAGGNNFPPETRNILAVGFIISCLLWLVAGIFTCFKYTAAVYLGLVLSYISAIGNLSHGNVCAILLLVLVIWQAHRVLGFAKKMRERGIPLTTRVDQIPID